MGHSILMERGRYLKQEGERFRSAVEKRHSFNGRDELPVVQR